MEIAEIAVKTKLSLKDSQRQISESETRSYELNKQKAMRKKLEATEKNEVEIINTGGGIKIKLNTGAYELLKLSAEQYYSCENDKYKFQKIPVTDKKGNIVETKYKVSSGKSPVYTFNMYHTKSSCLVNGKQVNQFINDDFPNLIQGIENCLEVGNTTIEDVNSQFKALLNQYKSISDPGMRAEDRSVRSCDTLPSTAADSNAIFHSEDSSVVSQNKNDDDNAHENGPDHCDSKYDKYIGLLQSIAESVKSLHTSLESHIQLTDRNFGQIRDEIQSVKKQILCENEHKVMQIDDIKTTANDLRHTVVRNYEGLTRRLQQITDLIRNMPVRNLSTAGESTTTPTTSTTEPAVQPAQSPITRVPERNRTLLIGSSIVKGIQPPGMATNVELVKISGAKIKDVARRLDELDTRHYNDVIIHVGGNDVSDGKQPDASYRELRNVTQKLQEQRCKVHLCTVCPRRDADVSDFNSRVRQLCRETGADLIDCYQAFVYGNGETVRSYFTRDGIHLTDQGSRTLVATVNSHIHIIRDRDSNKKTPRKQDNYYKHPGQTWGTFPRQSRNNFCSRMEQNRRYSH